MRFRIEAPEASAGLRVIPEIPSYNMCHVEGQNGIGKTVAAHLLELATGQQPYEGAPAAWRALKASLGAATILVDGLPGGQLEVRLHPEGWPEEPEPIGEWVGSRSFGGEDIALEDVRRLLQVFRISGDDTFEGTVATRLSRESATVERVADKLQLRLSALEPNLRALDGMMSRAGPQQLAQDRLRASHLEQQLQEAEKGLSRHRLAVEQLEGAALARRRLQAVEDETPMLKSRLDEIEKEIKRADEEQAELEAERTELQVSVERALGLADAIKTAEQRRKRRATRLRNLEITAQRQSQDLGVTDSQEAVEAELAVGEIELEGLKVQRVALDATDRMREVGDDISEPLEWAMREGLRDQVVAHLEDSRELRVGDLHSAVERRRAELDLLSPIDAVTDLDRDIRMVRERLTHLRGLRDTLVKKERQAELLQESVEELESLVDRQSSDVTDRYREITQHQQANSEQLQAMLRESVQLGHQLEVLSGGRSPEDLRAELHIALSRAGLKAEVDLEGELHDARGLFQRGEQSVAELRAALSSARRAVTAREAEIQRVSEQLLTREEFSWVRLAAAPLSADLDGSQVEAFLARLDDARARAYEQLYELRDVIDRLAQSVRGVARAVDQRQQAARPSATSLEDEVRGVFAKRLRTELDQSEIRNALFDGGVLESIDLERLEATWRLSDGEVRSRPLEAFSSGEQAFAYTRAMIERVGDVEASRKLVILDEFGAFIARDRLERLALYLSDRIINYVADQVVIILPLAVDYAKQVNLTTGPLRERIDARATAVQRDGYFTEQFDGLV